MFIKTQILNAINDAIVAIIIPYKWNKENIKPTKPQIVYENNIIILLCILQSGSGYLVAAVAKNGGSINSVFVMIVMATKIEIEIIKFKIATSFFFFEGKYIRWYREIIIKIFSFNYEE